VPLGAVSLFVAAASVRDSRDDSAPRQLDVIGAVLVASGVALFSIAVDRDSTWGWLSPQTVG
jgi:hypothetical protein